MAGLLRQFLLVRGTSLGGLGLHALEDDVAAAVGHGRNGRGEDQQESEGGGSEGTHGKSPRMSSPVVCAGATVAPVTH